MSKHIIYRALFTVRLIAIIACVLSFLSVPLLVEGAEGNWIKDGNKVFVDDENVYLSAAPHTLGSSGWVEFELLSKRYSGDIDIVLGFQSSDNVTMKKPQIWAGNVPHEKYRMVEAEKVGALTVTGIVAFAKLDWATFEGKPDIGNRNNIHLYEVTAIFYEFGELETLTVAFNDYILDGDTATVTYNYDSWEREVYYEYYPDWEPFIAEFDRHSEVAYGADTWDIVSTDAPIEADRLYKLRVWVEIPFAGLGRVSGKYVFGVKPSNETVGDARENGHLYVIDPWWNSSWTYRKTLTFDNTASTENLEWFPVLVHLDDTNIDWANVQNAGQDIRFVDSDDTTELDYEIEEWDDINDAWIWVEVPRIDAGVDTDFIYMYYGNAGAADGQDVEGTWDEGGANNYVMVQHMYDNPDTSHITDSTQYDNDGTKAAANLPAEIGGMIGEGQEFEGTTAAIELPTSESLINYTGKTLILLINTPSYDGVSRTYYYGGYAASPWGDIVQFKDSSNGVTIALKNTDGVVVASVTIPYTPNEWMILGFSWDGATVTYYKDGAPVGAPSSLSGTLGCSEGHRLGKYRTTQYYDGIGDEVRISDIARSADWIEATYLSMTEAMITFGSETPVPANPPTDFTLTQVEDYQVDASWTLGVGNTNVMLRRKVGSYPADRTDGVSVYEGAGTSVSDTADDVGLELDKYTYYYRIWGQNALGAWSDYDEGIIGGNTMTLLAFVGFAGIMSFLSVRSTYWILKVLAGLSWWAIAVYWIDNPPSVITQGDATDTTVIILLVFIGFVFMLMPFWYTRFQNGQEMGGRLRFPFMATDEQIEEERTRRQFTTRQERNTAYRDRVDAALRGERYRR